jgi:hypothetical protein
MTVSNAGLAGSLGDAALHGIHEASRSGSSLGVKRRYRYAMNEIATRVGAIFTCSYVEAAAVRRAWNLSVRS